ncbi:N-formylglutamate amidohydrolase [Sulfitobacter sp. SK012]|uniref:N-formylglutamate amidohydrolase n=1 Tax=Sulfitobacter sp. SK012 TaxID=1389005 RepID=UPI000E0A47B1|nr:N-formylglutamate amidohydrolase [Sulfitobacter sp. SK012]AXI45636.1 N-formylglutamate amidohydrolase [Sulfitobacter sp. SK012]
MSHLDPTSTTDPVTIVNPHGQSCVVVVCEHASFHIPEALHNLGLTDDALTSHAAWDPGALAVAQGLAQHFDATLVASNVSRLVYDCNRPPTAPDAMPAQSETISIPGNKNLSPAQKKFRTDSYYEPFRAQLAQTIAGKPVPVIVTIHSFTPIYHGTKRAVEIGVLHDTDARLADALLQIAPRHLTENVQRNEPYGPQHGVTHTLKEHALEAGHLNVMLEIRNDLIETAIQQAAMAKNVANWLEDALAQLNVTGGEQCQA